ncbi:hypothetical protein O0I10_010073 [Lichtheimia ornata]|uniref:Uncharacterized protein n=1 Tax=Lichtheimia ornata TaxID=688661 RepID=A0AAD7UY56_9FUNG|nr:uncharacterized protein O0I10_010073 [Lichtheimia ornata]KAJ8654251.1 hypothetical protein O0I10_010073 [Lichtheimia ornata]
MKDGQHYHIPEDGIHPGDCQGCNSMAQTHVAQMGTDSGTRRLSVTVSQATDSMESSSNPIVTRGSDPCGSSGCNFSQLQGDREITHPRRQVPFKLLYDQRAQQNSSHIGLQTHQPIHSMQSLQDGRGSSLEGFNREGRLDDEIGSERRLRGGTYSRGIEALSFLQASRHSVPIPVSTFWLECGTERFFRN